MRSPQSELAEPGWLIHPGAGKLMRAVLAALLGNQIDDLNLTGGSAVIENGRRLRATTDQDRCHPGGDKREREA